MRKLKHLVKERILLFILLLPGLSKAQEMPNVLLPSPTTQELNKYIDFPVDYSTGVPEISIPLYVIKTKGLEIPITLNYHASGIKHGQDDGNVGVGWSLSSDYRISRTIYGHPDESGIEMSPSSYQSQMSYFDSNLLFPLGPVNYVDRHLLYPHRDKDKYLRRFVNIVDFDNSMPTPSGMPLDGEYDLFNYSIPGDGGKFIISDRIAKNITEFNFSTNLFDYIEGTASNNIASGIIGFTVKDENQNLYSFGEQVDKLGFQVLETNSAPLDRRNITAWAMTDIETKYGDHIKFSYETKTSVGKYKRHLSLDIVEPISNTETFWEHSYDDVAKNASYNTFSLSSIQGVNENVEFITFSAPINQIQYINVRDAITDEIIKRIEFSYVTESFDIHPYVILESIKIYGKDLVDFQMYSFQYYDQAHYGSSFFAGKYLVPDAWGYNKLEDSPVRTLHVNLGDDHTRPNGDPFNTNRISGTLSNIYAGNLSDRMGNTHPELLSLKKITYPTGGQTLYEYEPNSTNSVPKVYRGGIRIKEISHYDRKIDEPSVMLLNLKRTYEYNDAYAGYVPDEDEHRKEYAVFQLIDGGPSFRRGVSYSGNNFGDQTELDSRAHYTKVTERIASGVEFLGRTEYQFASLTSAYHHPFEVEHVDPNGIMQYYIGGPTYLSEIYHWKRPVLLMESVFDKNNNMVRKERYQYSQRNLQQFIGLKVRPNAVLRDGYNEDYPYYYSYTSSIYNHGLYTLEVDKQLLTNKTVTIYREGDSVSTHTSYTYNAADQIVTETLTDSRSDDLETLTVYPKDIPSNYIAGRMIAANDVAKPLERTTKRNGNIIHNTKYQYQELPDDLFVLDKLKVLNLETSLAEDDLVFHSYDDLGNIQSFSKAGGVISNYLWSYEGQYPVAEVKGIDFASLEALLGGAVVIKNFSELANPSKSIIDNFLLPLRNAIAAGTLTDVAVSSFTYDRINGVLTQTDATGNSIYYEYDAFGRLHLIRDTDQAIEQYIKYNYRNDGGL